MRDERGIHPHGDDSQEPRVPALRLGPARRRKRAYNALPVDPVAQTSRWMAAARARESERPYRLFDDPLAPALAGPEGFAWLQRMQPVPRFGGLALYVVLRTRFFDDFLGHACWGAGARQVVLLAAGMDARAFRLNWPPRTRLYELDRPEVLLAKDEILARAQARPACERRAIDEAHAFLGGVSQNTPT
jgi:methyltransferase (TIGR00027 family)